MIGFILAALAGVILAMILLIVGFSGGYRTGRRDFAREITPSIVAMMEALIALGIEVEVPPFIAAQQEAAREGRQ